MKMDFDKCWNEHLNQGDDAVTLEMIDRYGIGAVRQLAELAFRMGEQNASQQEDDEQIMHKPCNEMTPHEILIDSLEMLMLLMGNVQGYMRKFDEPEIQVHAESLDKMADMVQRWRDEIYEREVEDE
jgi:hypothetical protein